MSESNLEKNNWKYIINNFFLEKLEREVVRDLKIIREKVDHVYRNNGYFNNPDIELIFKIKTNQKEKNQTDSNFLEQQLFKLKNFNQIPTGINLETIYNEINQIKEKLYQKYHPSEWISWASQNAKSVTYATHVTKLTHSSIDSPSIFDGSNDIRESYLSTSSLPDPVLDGAVRGNQYSPIFQFLELELDNIKLYSLFKDRQNQVLKPFSQNESQLKEWNDDFYKIFEPQKLKAHSLLKQTYFPIDENKYHLLCNITSSSIAQSIHDSIRNSSFVRRGNKKSFKFSADTFDFYPNLASLYVTASNHGNASQLNGKRAGRLTLFSCAAPVWKSNLKPPIYYKSFFYALTYNKQIIEKINFLKEFLIRFDKLDLSIKDPKRIKWIEKFVLEITEIIFDYICNIRELQPEWSKKETIKLKKTHQLLLDSQNEDVDTNIQKEICKDFAFWLNNQLVGKDKLFTPNTEHTKLWIKIFEPELREFVSTINLKSQTLRG